MRHVLAAVAMIPLVACTMTTPDKTIPDDCGAEQMQNLVGQPERVLQGLTFIQPVRIIHPGEPVTMDYAPGRLNFGIDQSGRIARVYCG